MILFYLRKFLHTLFSIFIALAISVLTVTSLFVGFFSSEDYVKQHINQNEDGVIAQIDSEVQKLAPITGLDKNAFVGAVNKDNFDVVSKEIAKNLRYGYETDFSSNTELYNIYSASISNPARNGGKTLKSSDVSRYASLAVATACKAINTGDTANVSIYNLMRNNFFIVAVVVAIVVIVVSVVFLEVANKGRHRKYSFIGMGIITSGYILIAGTYFVNKMDYIGKNAFLSFEPYNKAIQSSVYDLFQKNYIIGAILFAAGFIMLALNYNYFRKKNIIANNEREYNKRLVTDFLEYDEPADDNKRANGSDEYETEVSKIDFNNKNKED